MRIGMLLSSPLPPRDGVGFYAWNLACFLRDRGHEVHLITRGGARPAPAQNLDGLIIHRPVFWPVFPFQFQVHAIFVTNLLRQLRASLDLLHLHFPLVLPPGIDLPWLLTMHAPVSTHPLTRRIEQTLLSDARQVTAVSPAIARQLGRSIPVLGNGVFTDFFVPAPPRIFLPEKPVFLAVGQLSPQRGWGDFIQACQKVHFVYPNARFMLIGSGPLENDLRQEINRAGLDGVIRLVGQVTDRMTLSIFYQNAYAYVHPSPYEHLPTVLLEAMSCGKAVIAVEQPGEQVLIQDGENGLLVPARRPDELAHAMLRFLENPDLVSTLGLAARRTVEVDYSWETLGQRYLAEYQHLLEQPA